jgi:hypothetical protein
MSYNKAIGFYQQASTLASKQQHKIESDLCSGMVELSEAIESDLKVLQSLMTQILQEMKRQKK